MQTDPAETLPSPLAQKSTALLFLAFLFMFMAVRPYEHASYTPQNASEYLFMLYQFIIGQTLGIVHEGGHGICYLLSCPQFITVLNGTLFQLLFPFLVGYYYKRRGNRLGYLIGLFFLGFSLQYTAWYMGTTYKGAVLKAHESFLGVDSYHDFYAIFSTLGILEYYNAVSKITRAVAYMLMFYSVFKMLMEAFFNSATPKRRSRRKIVP